MTRTIFHVLLALSLSLGLSACDSDTGPDTGADTEESGGHDLPLGSECSQDSDCESNTCTRIEKLDTSYCSSNGTPNRPVVENLGEFCQIDKDCYGTGFCVVDESGETENYCSELCLFTNRCSEFGMKCATVDDTNMCVPND